METTQRLLGVLLVFGSMFCVFSCKLYAGTLQKVVTDKGDDVQRVGDYVWFIKNIQTDSLLCHGDTAGMCQIQTSFRKEVDVVHADQKFPLDAVINAYKKADTVPFFAVHKTELMTPLFFSFTYNYPIYQRAVWYNHKTHRMEEVSLVITGWNINLSSILVTIILFLFLFFLIQRGLSVQPVDIFRGVVNFSIIITSFYLYCLYLVPSREYPIGQNTADNTNFNLLESGNAIMAFLVGVILLVFFNLFSLGQDKIDEVAGWLQENLPKYLYPLVLLPPFALTFLIFKTQSDVSSALWLIVICGLTVGFVFFVEFLSKQYIKKKLQEQVVKEG